MPRTTTGQRVQAAHQEWYVAGATPGATYAAVELSNGERTTSTLGAGPYVSLECYASCATQGATVKLQARTTHDGAWRDLSGTETALTAGAAASEIYSGVLRAAEVRLAAKYTTTTGAVLTAEICLK